MKRKALLLIALVFSLTQCKVADLSQNSTLDSKTSEEKAKRILNELIENQGFKALENEKVYSYTATDDWPGFAGKLATFWPEPQVHVEMKYSFNTFDAQATFLKGEEKGNKVGLQSWKYYEQKEGQATPVLAEKTNDKYKFGLAALQYFNELPYRLIQAPVLRYYGEKEHKGKKYHLVFATWDSEEAHMEHDQYVLWVNQETMMIDYALFTVREGANAITRKFYGSIAYRNYKEVDGFKVATEQIMFLNDAALKSETLDDYFHKVSIEKFEAGGFPEADLYPFNDIPKMMNSK